MGEWKRKQKPFWRSSAIVLRLLLVAVVLAALAALYLQAEPTQAPMQAEPADEDA